MKTLFWISCLITGVVCLPLDFPSQTKVLAADQTVIQIAQKSSSFNYYMRLGYQATSRRNYRQALRYFEQARQIRPNNKYAVAAIRNVQSYIQRRSRIVFVPAGKPYRKVSAGTRGSCFLQEQRTIPLIPSSKEAQLTTAEYPTFLLYIPETDRKVQAIEFVLQDDETNEKFYSHTFQPVNQGSIVSVKIPENKPSLVVGKQYTWSFSVICDFDNRDQDQYIEGKIERLQDENLSEQLKETTNPLDQAMIYATAGLWENALTLLAELRQQRPNDAEVNKYWTELLNSVELEAVANKQILPCCTVQE
jgi:tetratricopeptide (TPR) repeat protein